MGSNFSKFLFGAKIKQRFRNKNCPDPPRPLLPNTDKVIIHRPAVEFNSEKDFEPYVFPVFLSSPYDEEKIITISDSEWWDQIWANFFSPPPQKPFRILPHQKLKKTSGAKMPQILIEKGGINVIGAQFGNIVFPLFLISPIAEVVFTVFLAVSTTVWKWQNQLELKDLAPWVNWS